MAPIAAYLLAMPPAAIAICTLDLPLPPDPLPAGFDWTPLAMDWCDQLAACGYPPSECFSVYMSVISSPIPSPESPPADDGVVTTVEDSDPLECVDSDEYAAGTVSCLESDPSPVPALEAIGLAVLTLTFVAIFIVRRSFMNQRQSSATQS